MASIEGLCCFDDGGRGTVTARKPREGVQARCVRGCRNLLDSFGQLARVGLQRSCKTVQVPLRKLVIVFGRLSWHENWHNRRDVTGLMEMLEVQAVAVDLV